MGINGRNPWPLQLAVSLAWLDIWHLHGSTDNRCELQNGPAWFLSRYQSALQILDWLIPLAYSKPSKDVCCQSGGSHVETSGKVTQLEEARRRRRREGRGGGETVLHKAIITSRGIIVESNKDKTPGLSSFLIEAVYGSKRSVTLIKRFLVSFMFSSMFWSFPFWFSWPFSPNSLNTYLIQCANKTGIPTIQTDLAWSANFFFSLIMKQ